MSIKIKGEENNTFKEKNCCEVPPIIHGHRKFPSIFHRVVFPSMKGSHSYQFLLMLGKYSNIFEYEQKNIRIYSNICAHMENTNRKKYVKICLKNAVLC